MQQALLFQSCQGLKGVCSSHLCHSPGTCIARTLGILRMWLVTFQARWGQRKVVRLRAITLDRKPTPPTEETKREFMLPESS